MRKTDKIEADTPNAIRAFRLIPARYILNYPMFFGLLPKIIEKERHNTQLEHKTAYGSGVAIQTKHIDVITSHFYSR